MKIDAILFDLDDTLIVDEGVVRDAFAASAHRASRYGADPGRFLADVQRLSLRMWEDSPHHGYCCKIGVNDIECLWGDFDSPGECVRALREWSKAFRKMVFDLALREQKIENPDAAAGLSDFFARQRRELQRLAPGAVEVLEDLKGRYRIGLLTNGVSDIQREKLEVSGLGTFFDEVVVSGEHESGKPDPKLFHRLLESLGSVPESAVMVGNSLQRDVAGAKAAGVLSIWVEAPGAEEPADVEPDHTIRSLVDLPPLLSRIGQGIPD